MQTGSDFIHYGSDGSFQSGFTNTDAHSLRVLPSSSASLRGECSVKATVRLQLDGQEVAQVSGAKVIEYTFRGDEQSAGMHQLTLEIDTGTGYFATDSLTIERLQAGSPSDPQQEGKTASPFCPKQRSTCNFGHLEKHGPLPWVISIIGSWILPT